MEIVFEVGVGLDRAPVGHASGEGFQFGHLPMDGRVIPGIGLRHQIQDAEPNGNRCEERLFRFCQRRSQWKISGDGSHLADVVVPVRKNVFPQTVSHSVFEQRGGIARIEEGTLSSVLRDMTDQFSERGARKLLLRLAEDFDVDGLSEDSPVGGKQGVAISALSSKIEEVVPDGVRRGALPDPALRLLPALAVEQNDQSGLPDGLRSEPKRFANVFVEARDIAALRPDPRGDVPFVLFCEGIRPDAVENRVAKFRQPICRKVESVPVEDRPEDYSVPPVIVEFQKKPDDLSLVRDERSRCIPELGGNVAIPEHGLERRVRVVDAFQHFTAPEDEIAKAVEAALRIGDLLQGLRRVAQISGNLGRGDPASTGAGRLAETSPELFFGG